MSTAVLSLGSNVGDRAANIKKMENDLRKLSKTPIIRSPLYETEAIETSGKQENYYNKTLRLETDLSPTALLKKTQEIEKKLGRKAKGEKLPRTADIDILLFDELKINAPELTVPHPRLFFRKFAIEGVKAVAGDLRDPFTGRKFADYEMCEKVKKQKTTKIE